MPEVPDPFADRILYRPEAKEARENPDKWFRLQTKDTPERAWTAAAQIKAGRRAAFRPAGTYDAVARGCDVLIRYLGRSE